MLGPTAKWWHWGGPDLLYAAVLSSGVAGGAAADSPDGRAAGPTQGLSSLGCSYASLIPSRYSSAGGRGEGHAMRRTSWVKTRRSLHPRVEVAIWPLPNANRRAGSGPSFDGLTPLRDAGAPALSAARPRKPNKACKRERR